jgi:ribosome-binding protein aMBF1 (putative translation factor)
MPMSEHEERKVSYSERLRRRLTPETMTPEQRAAYERRKAERETPEYQEQLARDIEAIKREFPPLEPDDALLEVLAALRRRREALGLSLADVMERSRIDRATLNKLENGKVPNPTYTTMKRYARALGLRLGWTLSE